MNTLTIRDAENGPHLLIDDIPLDQFLAQKTGHSEIEGLITTWSGELITVEDQDYVWQQSQLSDQPTMLPILVCPDDLDFSCTTIAVEVITEGETVIWQLFAFDTTVFDTHSHPAYVGKTYQWLTGVPVLSFDKHTYLAIYHTLYQQSQKPQNR